MQRYCSGTESIARNRGTRNDNASVTSDPCLYFRGRDALQLSFRLDSGAAWHRNCLSIRYLETAAGFRPLLGDARMAQDVADVNRHMEGAK
jgi:hypothetical protein